MNTDPYRAPAAESSKRPTGVRQVLCASLKSRHEFGDRCQRRSDCRKALGSDPAKAYSPDKAAKTESAAAGPGE